MKVAIMTCTVVCNNNIITKINNNKIITTVCSNSSMVVHLIIMAAWASMTCTVVIISMVHRGRHRKVLEKAKGRRASGAIGERR